MYPLPLRSLLSVSMSLCLTQIRALDSFRSLKWECKKGEFITKTIDCFTRPGCVSLTP